MKTKTYKKRLRPYVENGISNGSLNYKCIGLKVYEKGFCRPVVYNSKESDKYLTSELIRLNPNLTIEQLFNW